MEKHSKIYIAGYKGLVGSAIKRRLERGDYTNLIYSDMEDFDLQRQAEVERFLAKEKPEFLFLAAAKVGGIWANKTYPGEFIYNNLIIQANIIHTAYKQGVKKLLFLGSSCIYPKFAPQPMKEEHLLTSPLEPTNEAYAIAKIAGLKMCRYYNQQYKTNFISVMPTNLYGPGDNYNLENSHVLPALIRKLHLAHCLETDNWGGIKKDLNKNPIKGISGNHSDSRILDILANYGITRVDDQCTVTLWGTGSPRREFLYVEDLADAVVFLMEKFDFQDIGEIINIGTGNDCSIKEAAGLIKEIVGFRGSIKWDKTKPDGTPRKLLDVSRLNELGWQESHSFKSGLGKTYRHYLEIQ